MWLEAQRAEAHQKKTPPKPASPRDEPKSGAKKLTPFAMDMAAVEQAAKRSSSRRRSSAAKLALSEALAALDAEEKVRSK